MKRLSLNEKEQSYLLAVLEDMKHSDQQAQAIHDHLCERIERNGIARYVTPREKEHATT